MDGFGKRLRLLRGNLNQENLASELNVSRSTMSSYEHGREPSYDLLVQLADYFDVSIDYLLGRTPDKKPSSDTLANTLNQLASPVETAGADPLSQSDFVDLAEKLLSYYQDGAPAGNAPIEAVKGYLSGMCGLLDALKTGSTSAIVAALNEVTVQQLGTMEILSEYLKLREI